MRAICATAASSSISPATSAATARASPSYAAATTRCFVATGVYRARDLTVPGCGLPGIVPALDFLTASNRKGLGDNVPAFDDGTLDAAGKHVVVIGGGDTAMDCVRTAVRQGARSVKCLYRRDRANMPGSHARGRQRRGGGRRVRLAFGARGLPRRRRVEARARAPDAARTRRMHPAARRPRSSPGSTFRLDADLVIQALGFDPEDMPGLFGEPDLKVSRWGTIQIDWSTHDDQPARACSPAATSCAAPRLWSGGCATAATQPRASTPGWRPAVSPRTTWPWPREVPTMSTASTRRACPLARRRRAPGRARPVRSCRRARRLRRGLRRRHRRPAAARGRGQGHRGAEGGLAPRGGRRRRQDRRRGRHARPDPAGLLPAQDQGRRAAPTSGSRSAWCSCRARASQQQEACRTIVESEVLRFGYGIRGWRQVPVDISVLGEKAAATRPEIEQIIIGNPKGADEDRFELDLYLIRRRIERQALAENIADFYICSLQLPLGDLQGHVPRRIAGLVLSRPPGRAVRVELRAVPPALFDQHLPGLEAGAALPHARPQWRDQHAARQRQLDEEPRDADGRRRVRRPQRGRQADHPAGRLGQRRARRVCEALVRAGRPRRWSRPC